MGLTALPISSIFNVGTARLVGRNSAGTGVAETLTAAVVRGMINVEDGATADQTGAEIVLAIVGEADSNLVTDAQLAKINQLPLGDNKLDGTGPPDANDDSANTGGNGTFLPGSLWVDLTADEAYRCLDATPTAAVWVKTTLDSGELAAIAFDGLTSNLVGTIATSQIANSGVTFAKFQNISTARILGRNTAGSGIVEELDAATLRTMINVEDGATADQSDAEIATAYGNEVAIVSQVAAEAGTSTSVFRWTPERVAQAIAALGGGGASSPLVLTAGSAAELPLELELAASHTANALEVNSNGGSGGDLASLDNEGKGTFDDVHICSNGLSDSVVITNDSNPSTTSNQTKHTRVGAGGDVDNLGTSIGANVNAGSSGVAVGVDISPAAIATVVIGRACSPSQYSVVIGQYAKTTGTSSANGAVAIGTGTSSIDSLRVHAAANQCVIGAVGGLSQFILGGYGEFYGLTDVQILPGGRTGTDLAGYDLELEGGRGTGTGAGGSIRFKTAEAGSTGSTANALVEHMEIREDGLIILPTIPTSDPGVSGALWSDSGTLKVS